jgi:hypothetical protein
MVAVLVGQNLEHLETAEQMLHLQTNLTQPAVLLALLNGQRAFRRFLVGRLTAIKQAI